MIAEQRWSAPWRAGAFGPVVADPRKQNEILYTAPHEIRVDDWYELTTPASFVRRNIGQSRLLPLLVPSISITIDGAMGLLPPATSKRVGVLLCTKKVVSPPAKILNKSFLLKRPPNTPNTLKSVLPRRCVNVTMSESAHGCRDVRTKFGYSIPGRGAIQ